MPSQPSAEEPRPDDQRNRLMQAIDRSPSVGTALGGFGAYMFGAVLLMVAVFLLLAGLLFVVATLGSGGWQDRLLGVALLGLGALLFLIGRWATGQYTVQRGR